MVQDRPAPALRLPRPRLPGWLVNAAVLLALWQFASLVAGRTVAGAPMVPGLADMAVAFKLFGNYWPGGLGLGQTAAGEALTWRAAVYALFYNSGLTLLRLLAGFGLGLAVGIGLAVAVSWSNVLRKMLIFPAHVARMLPLLALIPLFNLWFGNTETAAVLFVGLVTFCVIFAASIGAVAAVPGYYRQYAASLGCRPLGIYLTVVLPAAMPRIAVGIVVAHGFAWGAAIASEFLGMQYGLGRIVFMAQEFNQFNLLAVAAFVTVIVAVSSHAVLTRLIQTFARSKE